MKAIYNGVTIAESEKTVVVEGNHYFPRESVRWEHLEESEKHTTCAWKGQASYYTVTADGKSAPDAAWYYPHPKRAAAGIENHVAFWRGVKVVRDDVADRTLANGGTSQAPIAGQVERSQAKRPSLLARLGLR